MISKEDFCHSLTMLYLEKNVRVFSSPENAVEEYYKAYVKIKAEYENHKQNGNSKLL